LAAQPKLQEQRYLTLARARNHIEPARTVPLPPSFRGDRREAIFADDADRQRWLETLSQACQKTGWQVHAYCLMRNHFHLGASHGAAAGRGFAG
jgi:hypothetical protein